MSRAKIKFPRAVAIEVASQIIREIKPVCEFEFLKICGSLRRGKQQVGDIEIVFVSKVIEERDGLFDVRKYQAVVPVIESLIKEGIIKKRLNVNGSETWGPENKYAVHCRTGVPIDFFATKKSYFWNYVVCRTGGEKTNIRIATAAKCRGLKWKPYHGGFLNRKTGEMEFCYSEEEVFRRAGLNYLPPGLRA